MRPALQTPTTTNAPWLIPPDLKSRRYVSSFSASYIPSFITDLWLITITAPHPPVDSALGIQTAFNRAPPSFWRTLWVDTSLRFAQCPNLVNISRSTATAAAQTLSGSLRGVNPTNWALMSKGTRALRQWRRREGHPEGLELLHGGRINEIESRARQGDSFYRPGYLLTECNSLLGR